MQNRRYTIGLLAANIVDTFSNSISKGAMRAAKRLDVDLIIFPGKYLGLQHKYEEHDTKYEYQYNVLFSHAAEAGLDYIIAPVGSIAYAVDDEGKKRFLDSFGDTPVLSVCAESEDHDFLQFDNRSGVAAAVDYLASRGRKRIAILAGDLRNSECAERYEEYRLGLERNGIPFEDRYLCECDMAYDSKPDCDRLLDNNPDLDAVVCVNDIVAQNLYESLADRGLEAGSDIAVVGFDDLPMSKHLDPPLASINADAELLGERSVEKAVNYLNGVEDDCHYISTKFIPRASCFSNVRFMSSPQKIFSGSNDEIYRNIREYVNEICDTPAEGERVFSRVINVFKAYQDTFVKKVADEADMQRITELTEQYFTNSETLSDGILKLSSVIGGGFIWLLRNCKGENLSYVTKLYDHFGGRLNGSKSAEELNDAFMQRVHNDNIFIRDALMLGGDLKQSYGNILKRLCNIGAMTSFLFTLEQPVTVKLNGSFPKGMSWRFRSYCYGSQSYIVPEEEQEISMRDIFKNEHVVMNRQHIFIAADLYTAENQYGMALLEPRDDEFFGELELATYQLSSAVRTLDILKEQDNLLAEVHSRNLALEEMSMIDELTQVFNRRGFYMAAGELINANKGGRFIICYADMDDLKIVNDTYGHAEGDFCIRLTGKCLGAAMGEAAVIGRMGGDEFAAIVLKQEDLSIEDISARKESFIAGFNASGSRVYSYSSSLGILEYTCENSYDLKEALDKADGLLYEDKSRKKAQKRKNK